MYPGSSSGIVDKVRVLILKLESPRLIFDGSQLTSSTK